MLNIVHGLIIGLCINGLNVTFSTQDQRWRGERGGGDAFILDNSDSTVNRQQNVVKMVIPTPVCIPYSAAPANRHYGPGISLEKKARLFSQKIEYYGKEWHGRWIISTMTAVEELPLLPQIFQSPTEVPYLPQIDHAWMHWKFLQMGNH